MNIETLATALFLSVPPTALACAYVRKRRKRLRKRALSEIEMTIDKFYNERGDEHAFDHFCEIVELMTRFRISFDELTITEEELKKDSLKALRRARLWYFLTHSALKRSYRNVDSEPQSASTLGTTEAFQSSQQYLAALAGEYRRFASIIAQLSLAVRSS